MIFGGDVWNDIERQISEVSPCLNELSKIGTLPFDFYEGSCARYEINSVKKDAKVTNLFILGSSIIPDITLDIKILPYVKIYVSLAINKALGDCYQFMTLKN